MVFDFRFLQDASAALLGYFVHTWYVHYLSVIAGNFQRWYERGWIESLEEPAQRGRYSVVFDFTALNMEKIAYIQCCSLNSRAYGKPMSGRPGGDSESAASSGDPRPSQARGVPLKLLATPRLGRFTASGDCIASVRGVNPDKSNA